MYYLMSPELHEKLDKGLRDLAQEAMKEKAGVEVAKRILQAWEALPSLVGSDQPPLDTTKGYLGLK